MGGAGQCTRGFGCRALQDPLAAPLCHVCMNPQHGGKTVAELVARLAWWRKAGWLTRCGFAVPARWPRRAGWLLTGNYRAIRE